MPLIICAATYRGVPAPVESDHLGSLDRPHPRGLHRVAIQQARCAWTFVVGPVAGLENNVAYVALGLRGGKGRAFGPVGPMFHTPQLRQQRPTTNSPSCIMMHPSLFDEYQNAWPATQRMSSMPGRIEFQTEPSRYRHWKLKFEGEVAELIMDVDESATLFEGYQLKLNSYDLGVDIELADAVQRLRFEHPEVKVVVLKSGKDRVFCAGANIRMLAGSSHVHKVNFCKFTNETRNAMEDASEVSGQKYICAVRGTAAGGGYELALATDYILLADDGNSTVAMPELPLLAVLPGTGGLTRVTDKRKVRRDLADAFCTTEEGVKGNHAVKWRLIDELAPNSKFEHSVQEAARRLAAQSDRPADAKGVTLAAIERSFAADAIAYSSLKVEIDRARRRATLTLQGPGSAPPASVAALHEEG